MSGGNASKDRAVPLLHRPGPAVQVSDVINMNNFYYISSSGSSRRRRGWCQPRSQSPGSPPCLSLTKSPSPTDLPKIVTSLINIWYLYLVSLCAVSAMRFIFQQAGHGNRSWSWLVMLWWCPPVPRVASLASWWVRILHSEGEHCKN